MVKLTPSHDDLALLARRLRKMEFFCGLSPAQIDGMMKYVLYYGFKRGEAVVRQGDIGDAFYVVQEGQVEVSMKKGLLSFARKIAVLNPGDCFGEMALLERSPRNASVRASAPSKLFALTRSDFDYFLGENPAFAAEIKKVAERRRFESDRRQG